MTFLWTTYKMFLVGTVRLTKKKSRTSDDFPFHKLKDAALKRQPRGWMRRAVRTISCFNLNGAPTEFECEATKWKDRKEVGLFKNYKVKPRDNETLQRWVRGQKERQEIDAHVGVIDYNAHMGAVDRKDRDTADWGIQLRSPRWYMAIFWWLFNAQISAMYYITMYSIDAQHKWKKKHGRYRWQMDLSQELMAFAISTEWGKTEEERARGKPWWMRQSDPVPCNCGTCFFCKNGITHGISHPVMSAATKTPAQQRRKQRDATSTAANKKSHQYVELQSKSQCCLVCYNQWAKESEVPSLEITARKSYIRKKCNYTKLGCPGCDNLLICQQCWDGGYSHHTQLSQRDYEATPKNQRSGNYRAAGNTSISKRRRQI